MSDGGGEVGVAGEEDDEAVGNDAGELEDGVAELVEHGVGVALGESEVEVKSLGSGDDGCCKKV